MAIVSRGGYKVFFAYYVTTWSMFHVTRWMRYPHPKVIVRATELNIYVLQVRANFVTNWGSVIIRNWANLVTSGDNYYKLRHPLLQNRADITNWSKIYYKLGQVLQIKEIITNWSITYRKGLQFPMQSLVSRSLF